jgi:hypothetical protein
MAVDAGYQLTIEDEFKKDSKLHHNSKVLRFLEVFGNSFKAFGVSDKLNASTIKVKKWHQAWMSGRKRFLLIGVRVCLSRVVSFR